MIGNNEQPQKLPPCSLLGCWYGVSHRWASHYLPLGFIAELTDSALALPTGVWRLVLESSAATQQKRDSFVRQRAEETHA